MFHFSFNESTNVNFNFRIYKSGDVEIGLVVITLSCLFQCFVIIFQRWPFSLGKNLNVFEIFNMDRFESI